MRIVGFLAGVWRRWLVVLALGLAMPAAGQDLSALARLDAQASALQANDAGGLDLIFEISQPVPWRVRFLDGPPRLVIDTREVDWSGFQTLTLPPVAQALRAGSFRPGWSRLVIELAAPMALQSAEMSTRSDRTAILLALAPTDPESFTREATRPDLPEWAAPKGAMVAVPKPVGTGPLLVVLDPGHGGIDPGAERNGTRESDLMLTFARELKEVLVRDGRFSVVLTRDQDVFVPLETRTSIAREAQADLFLSLHADSLALGEAQGSTVYTLAEQATDAAAQALAERHDRDDLLAGVDLTQQDDVVANVLMDMARAQTQPRTDRLAKAIVGAIKAAEIRMHRNPHQTAAFSVLKSPDIPSVLLELGFLSSERDHRRLIDPQWRATLAEAVRAALVAWSEEETALRAVQSP